MLGISKLRNSFASCKKSLLLSYVLIRQKEKYIYAESFYPECERKKPKRIWYEQLRHVFKYGQINKQYFEYGIDRVGVNDDDFLDNLHYVMRRNKHNSAQPFDYLCLVKDKKAFAIFGKYYGFPIWDSIGILHQGLVKDDKDVKFEIKSILQKHQNIFVKPIDGGGGDRTYNIKCHEGQYFVNFEKVDLESLIETLKEISDSGSYLIQDIFMQNVALSALYEKSVNTLRVVTVNPKQSENKDDVILVACILRIGANGLVVDNHGKGGLEIAVDSEGKLEKYAYYRPGFGTKVERHPDSGLKFEGYQIPFYKEAIDLCLRFHTKLNKIHHIGWDIAFSEKGVYLFEANDCSGTKLQTFLGPLREQYKTWLPET